MTRSPRRFFTWFVWLWVWGLRIIAQSTGVSVRATRPERMMDVAMVMPNWR